MCVDSSSSRLVNLQSVKRVPMSRETSCTAVGCFCFTIAYCIMIRCDAEPLNWNKLIGARIVSNCHEIICPRFLTYSFKSGVTRHRGWWVFGTSPASRSPFGSVRRHTPGGTGTGRVALTATHSSAHYARPSNTRRVQVSADVFHQRLSNVRKTYTFCLLFCLDQNKEY